MQLLHEKQQPLSLGKGSMLVEDSSNYIFTEYDSPIGNYSRDSFLWVLWIQKKIIKPSYVVLVKLFDTCSRFYEVESTNIYSLVEVRASKTFSPRSIVQIHLLAYFFGSTFFDISIFQVNAWQQRYLTYKHKIYLLPSLSAFSKFSLSILKFFNHAQSFMYTLNHFGIHKN